MRNCVRVARQTLTLFVWVQILVPQPALRRTRFVLGSAFFYPLAHTAGHVFALPLYGVTPDPICFGFSFFYPFCPRALQSHDFTLFAFYPQPCPRFDKRRPWEQLHSLDFFGLFFPLPLKWKILYSIIIKKVSEGFG